MNVFVVPSDLGACGYERLIWPAQVCAENGMDVTIGNLGDLKFESALSPATGIKRVVNLVSVPDCDVLVIQRPVDWRWASLIPLFQAEGLAVVVDLDDRLDAVHRDNIAWYGVDPQVSPDSNWRHLGAATMRADMVTVSSGPLRDHWTGQGHECVRVLRNCVPAHYLKIDRRAHQPPLVGWGGALESHPEDVAVMRGAAARAARAVDARLHVVGPNHEVQVTTSPDGRLRAIHRTPSDTALDRAFGGKVSWTGACDFLTEWPAQVARLDVGLAPLEESVFNDAKSWLKVLEYSALGVPWVASPVPEYVMFAQYGSGLIAQKPNAWEGAIKALARDPQRRREMAELGRDAAMAWTYENRWRDWWLAWEHAQERRMAA